MADNNHKRLTQIEKRIEKIKAELIALEPMRPGSLTRQYKDPQARSGPYYQLSYTRDMKSRTDYIPRHCVRQVRRLIRNYHPGGHFKFPQLWPGQIPPGATAGT